jgi:hypothetical protein
MPTLNCVGGGATASKALQQPAAGEKLANGRNVAAATARIDSPDNDSAFSDNGSMLSSESSASSGTNGSRKTGHQNQVPNDYSTMAELFIRGEKRRYCLPRRFQLVPS